MQLSDGMNTRLAFFREIYYSGLSFSAVPAFPQRAAFQISAVRTDCITSSLPYRRKPSSATLTLNGTQRSSTDFIETK